jgi:hypothetical protein
MRERLKELLFLHGASPETSDLNLLKLADFLGVPSRSDTLANSCDNPLEAILQHSQGDDCAVCVGASTLRKCFDRSAFTQRLEVDGSGSSVQLFVYGFDPQDGGSELVHALSNGAFDAVRPLDGRADQYCVSSKYRPFCQEFSGLSFGPVARENDLVFEVALNQERIADYICIGDRPFLAGTQSGAVEVTLAGTREILDIDAPVAPAVRPLDWFSRLVPPLMFLRYAFGDRCWQAAKKLACFIVDDPLLHDRHGFLEYDTLVAAMEQEDFATNLAFIPWNYRRSHPRVAELFRRHPRRLSLSIHGCDHTKGEFGDTSAALLLSKARASRSRMAKHRELTGIPCDNVMVFPQGVFSTAALRAIEQAGFLAAVNSTPFPVDNPPEKLRVRDLLSPAVTRYSSLPLFIRHYPTRPAEFALDLFLGRPALMVEHHDYFRDGYQQLEAFAAQINHLSDTIYWCGLEEIARNSYLWRTDAAEIVHVRLFCDQSIVVNNWPTPRPFKFSKSLDRDQLKPPAVVAIGEYVAAVTSGSEVCFERMLQPGEQVTIEFAAPEGALGGGLRFGSAWYRAKVFARRRLCELRDNYVCRINLFGSDSSPRKTVMRQN